MSKEIKYPPRNNEEMLERLINDFPKCFTYNPKLKRPIIIGANEKLKDYYKEVLGNNFNKKFLMNALRYYANSPTYLRKVIYSSSRIDLDGNECGTVTEEEKKHAKEQYDKLHGRNTRKKIKKIIEDKKKDIPNKSDTRERLSLKKVSCQ